MAHFGRMRDLDFCVIITTTLLSTYFHRDALNRDYLQRFNDSFPKEEKVKAQLEEVFTFIDQCNFEKKCRVEEDRLVHADYRTQRLPLKSDTQS